MYVRFAGVGVPAGLLQQVLQQVRGEQMFGVGHGHVPVTHVHRVPGPVVERRVQGVRGEVDGLRVAGAGF